MNTNARLALGGLALAAAVAACGTATTPHPAATSHPASESPGPASSLGPGDVPVAKTVHSGQQFEVSFAYTGNAGTANWRLALSEIRCGGPEIFDAKILAADGVSSSQPSPGMQFCLVKFSVTNDSNSNQVWTARDVSVNVGMKAYLDEALSGPAYDVEKAYQKFGDPSSRDGVFGLNPGVSGVSWAVFEIPAGATATSVSVPIGTSLQRIGGVQQVLIELR